MGLLDNKVIIITGGTKGIGLAIAERFAAEGAKVIACSRHSVEFENSNIEFMQLDVTDSEACKSLVDNVFNKYKRIDCLVADAGITKDGMTYKMTDEMFDSVISVNLKGVFNIGRFVGPMMEKQGTGSIITISSVVGEYGNIGQANYAASKAGVIGLSKSWAKEFARKGQQVRVNVISPGYIMTDMLKTVPQDLLDKFADQTMLKRLGQPKEIANVALFLASELSTYITGSVLDANGGMRL